MTVAEWLAKIRFFKIASKSCEKYPKGWGEELWIVNIPLYCGKKLILKEGKKSSVHYHRKKDETFYVQSGIVSINLYPRGYPGPKKRIIMTAGCSLRIRPGLIHQFFGLKDSVIFEFSTQHFESDTVRLEKGD